MLELLGKGAAKAKVKVIPREPFRSMLKRLELEYGGYDKAGREWNAIVFIYYIYGLR
jgi:hypothetical protein